MRVKPHGGSQRWSSSAALPHHLFRALSIVAPCSGFLAAHFTPLCPLCLWHLPQKTSVRKPFRSFFRFGNARVVEFGRSGRTAVRLRAPVRRTRIRARSSRHRGALGHGDTILRQRCDGKPLEPWRANSNLQPQQNRTSFVQKSRAGRLPRSGRAGARSRKRQRGDPNPPIRH